MPLVDYSDSDGDSDVEPNEDTQQSDVPRTESNFQPALHSPTSSRGSQKPNGGLKIQRVREISIRSKLRTPAMKELIEGRKRAHDEDLDDPDDDTESRFRAPRVDPKAKSLNLPPPENASSLAPALPIESMLRLPERVNPATMEQAASQYMEEHIESLQELTVEREPSKPRISVVDPLSKSKNQITYLAQRAKLSQIKVEEATALGRAKRKESNAKYGF